MVELKHEIIIDSPPEKVWKILADLEAVRHYNPTVLTARYISTNREGVGASRECEVKPKGRVKERVTEWVPMQSMSMELYESDWPVRNLRWTTRLAPVGSGTRIAQTLQYQPKGLAGTVLSLLIMKRKMGKSIGEVFQCLKLYAEKT